jgi:hypothetical protein
MQITYTDDEIKAQLDAITAFYRAARVENPTNIIELRRYTQDVSFLLNLVNHLATYAPGVADWTFEDYSVTPS